MISHVFCLCCLNLYYLMTATVGFERRELKMGYWRWRFLQDTAGLDHLQPCSFNAFRLPLKTNCLDLREPPFASDATHWQHPTDYSATQALGRSARDAAIGAIIYQSVRDPDRYFCVAVLTPMAFAVKKPDSATQSWMLTITTEEAIWMCRDYGQNRRRFRGR